MDRTSLDVPSGRETAMASFMRDLRRKPKKLLSKEEEIELALRMRNGDRDAEREFIAANYGLVVKVVSDFSRKWTGCLDVAELVNEGYFGLLTAVRKFDPDRGCRFSTMAVPWIRRAVYEALYNQTKIIRIPRGEQVKLNKLRKAEQRLSSGGETPDPQEVARALGVSLEEANRRRRVLAGSASLANRGEPADDDERECDSGPISDFGGPSVEDVCDARRRPEFIRSLLSEAGVDGRSRQIILLRFGVGTGEELTHSEIGERIGLSGTYTGILFNFAMKQLRRYCDLRGYRVDSVL